MSSPTAPSPRAHRTTVVAALFVGLAIVVSACSSSPLPQPTPSPTVDAVTAAKAQVDAAKQDVQSAKTALKQAGSAFCDQARDYISAIDRYGKLFTDDTATVGDVQTLGADLGQPRSGVQAAAQGVLDARTQLEAANQALADAQNALAVAKAAAKATGSPAKTPKPSPSKTPSPLPTLPETSIDRVNQAESDLRDASAGITPQTPLTQAAESYNSAAFALEVAWLNLFADAGCLSDPKAQQAAEAVRKYTVALQTDLQTAGYYSDKVDGVYGPKTVKAVEALQKDAGLPVTGLVDQATAAALEAKVTEVEGAAAAAQSTETTAVQTALKLAGYWPGPIDGQWTPELTAALQQFQTDLGVKPTGTVDAATLAAFEQLLGTLTTPPPTPTATTAPETTSAPPATTAPTNTGEGTTGPTG